MTQRKNRYDMEDELTELCFLTSSQDFKDAVVRNFFQGKYGTLSYEGLVVEYNLNLKRILEVLKGKKK